MRARSAVGLHWRAEAALLGVVAGRPVRVVQSGDTGDRGAGQVGRVQDAGALPPADPHLDVAASSRHRAHPHRARRECPVHDLVRVRVLQGLTHLPDDRQLRRERHPMGLFGDPQVEPLPRLVVVVGQADAELGLHEILGAQDAVVLQAGHHPELVFGDPADALLLGRGGAGGRHLEPDPGPLPLRDAVVGQPLLPALTVGEGLLGDGPRARGALAALDQADPGHQLAQDRLLVRADRALVGLLEQQVGDAGQEARRAGAVDAVEAEGAARGQLAAQPGVVQEHRLLDERHDEARVLDRDLLLLGPVVEGVGQLRGEVLRLAAGELER